MDTELIARARRSRARENDFGLEQAKLPGDAPPPAVDLRPGWHAVGNQGRTASCVGWAVSDAVRWHLEKAGRLAADAPLSPRYVWMAAKETDKRTDYPSTFLEEDGTSLKAGLDVVRRWGAVLESELPWRGGLAAGPPEQLLESAAGRRIASYYNLGDDTVPDRSVHFEGWRRWLAAQGPVLVLVKLDRTMIGCDGELNDFDEASVVGSHAAALFGYGPDHFLLRSNWGQAWGDGGYAQMSLEYAAQAVIESYGVVV